MRRTYGELGRWLRRARPPLGALAGALGAASAASIVSLAMTIGAPALLMYSVGHTHFVAGSTLAIALLVIELMAFSRAPLRYVERLSGHELGVASVATWRRWLLVTIGAWSYREWSAAATGDLLERALADTDVLQDLWLRVVVPCVAALVTMAGADVVVALLPAGDLHPVRTALALAITQLVFVAYAALWLPVMVNAERSVRIARAQRTAERVSLQQVAPEIELLGRSPYLEQRLSQVTSHVERREEFRDARRRPLAWVALLGPLVLVVLIAAGVDSGHSSTGVSGLVVLLVAASFAETLALVRAALVTASLVSAAVERLENLARPERHGAAPFPEGTSLDVEGLGWITHEDRSVLAWLDLTVAPGRRVAITGANGAGKSTLLRLLARLDVPDAGTLRVGGVNLAEIDEASLRRHVAYVGSTPVLLDGVVDRVVRVGRLTTDALEPALAAVGLLASPTTRWSHLSRGEAQRAALVRALLDEPSIVLLDEPTSGLGADERDLVLARLSSLTATVIIATHDPRVVEFCDEVFELREGRLELLSR